MVVCIEAMVVISLTDEASGNAYKPKKIYGNLMSLMGAALFACYNVMIYVLMPAEKNYSQSQVLGGVSVINLVFTPILILIAHFINLETVELPSLKVFLYLTINSFSILFLDFFYMKATPLIGPLMSSTTLAIIIPITLIVDFIWSSKPFLPFYYIGTFGIIITLVSLNWEEYHSEPKQNEVNSDEDLRLKIN